MKRIAGYMLAVGALLLSPGAAAVCPQPAETEEGQRRGLMRRDFLKALRHEISLGGGMIASELLGSSLLGSVTYAFHLNEFFALEVAWSYSYQTSAFAGTVEQYTGSDVLRPLPTNIYTGSLVWHPFHGKFMFFQSLVPHFDMFLEAGVGITDNASSRGLTYSAGLGIKIFLNHWLSLRLKLRDLIGMQQLYGSESLSQNLELTLGVGFWLPW